MLLTLYYYNLPLTCKNVQIELYNFWRKNILNYNSKIWLTIDIKLTSNTVIRLIDNLPFNASDYNDALIVAEQKYKSLLLLCKTDMVDSIKFNYIIKDNKEYKHNNILLLGCMIINIMLITGLCYYFIFLSQPVFFVETPTDMSFVNENKSNKCLFGLFSDLFKINNSSYSYYPSCFLENCITTVKEKSIEGQNSSLILEHISREQYATLNYLTLITIEHIETMRDITRNYSEIINDLSA